MTTRKVHAFSPDPERHMPIDISKAFYAQGLRGSKCGYMRRVAFDPAQVTCALCLRQMQKTSTAGSAPLNAQ